VRLYHSSSHFSWRDRLEAGPFRPWNVRRMARRAAQRHCHSLCSKRADPRFDRLHCPGRPAPSARARERLCWVGLGPSTIRPSGPLADGRPKGKTAERWRTVVCPVLPIPMRPPSSPPICGRWRARVNTRVTVKSLGLVRQSAGNYCPLCASANGISEPMRAPFTLRS
jgi:hypothetical protein